MLASSLLDNISIVLVDTRTPANIGSTARCMMNMGLSRLVLVNPPEDRDNAALRLCAGADRILDNAVRAASLTHATAGHNLIIGTSRHAGRRRKNIRYPRDMAARLIPLLDTNRTAIVFGDEVNGLDNAALALCQEIISIPSSDAFPSLNLSHAVMIVAYELFLASLARAEVDKTVLAPADDLERFFHHLQETLLQSGFFEEERPERMMSTFRQIFGRARLDSRDVSILRGVLRSIDRHIR